MSLIALAVLASTPQSVVFLLTPEMEVSVVGANAAEDAIRRLTWSSEVRARISKFARTHLAKPQAFSTRIIEWAHDDLVGIESADAVVVWTRENLKPEQDEVLLKAARRGCGFVRVRWPGNFVEDEYPLTPLDREVFGVKRVERHFWTGLSSAEIVPRKSDPMLDGVDTSELWVMVHRPRLTVSKRANVISEGFQSDEQGPTPVQWTLNTSEFRSCSFSGVYLSLDNPNDQTLLANAVDWVLRRPIRGHSN